MLVFRFCLTFIVCCNVFSFAQTEEKQFQNFAKIYQDSNSKKSIGEISYYLVRFKSGISKADLKKYDVRFLRIMDNHTAIIQFEGLKNVFLFDDVVPANNLWKLSDEILHGNAPAESNYTVRVASMGVLEILKTNPEIEIIQLYTNVLTISCSFNTLRKQVITLEDVLYAGIESHEPSTESSVRDLNLEPNSVSRIHHDYPAFNGENVTISIKEFAFDPNDIDLVGRDLPSALASATTDGHTTDMATIAAGAGNSFVTGRGVAKAATITSSDFTELMPDLDVDFQSRNVSVQNHSYGTAIENIYGALAEAYDANTNRNPNLLHIFSSGNMGATTSTSGKYSGINNYANLTGNFKMAKNVLVVGSVDTVKRAIAFSSRGPAHDGRIKPELVTYSMAGSSNSAALVSGVSLILQQAYKEQKGVLPEASLLKALLINSADDAGEPGIDFITGYGNVNAFESLKNLLDNRFLEGSVNDGETQNFPLTVPPNVKQLKITLVWNDPAALPNSAVSLVNDLDLKLSDFGTGTWLPWILNTTPNSTLLAQAASRGADHLNNVEQITIDDPASGAYTISVSGFDVPQGPQKFHIAYQWVLKNEFNWSFPTASDNIPYNGETATYFRWRSTLTEQFGKLEYSVDSGAMWRPIQNNVDLAKGYFRWNAPGITAIAQARMVVGLDTIPTEIFTISRPVTVRIGFNCADSLLISWSKIPGAQAYDLLTLNSTYFEHILTTVDTSAILNKQTYPSKYFAIQPKLISNKPTIRSFAVDYTLQGVKCYVISLIADLVPKDGINLTLRLGTTYGVAQVIFEREDNENFTQIGSVIPTINPQINYFDGQPGQGFNVYRARIKFINGEEVISETTQNYFLTEIPFMIFPNPVSIASDLTIISKPFSSEEKLFTLFRLDGREVLRKNLSSDYESISLTSINPGLYIYSIRTVEGSFKGKLMIN